MAPAQRENSSSKKRKASTPKPPRENQRQQKRKRLELDLTTLEKAVQELDVKAHTTEGAPKTFAELPLSEPTATGLRQSKYKTMTEIQARALPHALKKHDILGAARTGSGKTLAFLVPVLENLYRAQWTEYDGLGAMILSPTRELALQIFEVLRKIGRFHGFSAGLVIGGKNLKDERERLGRMNILVCTPGRMLQHMDQTAAFDCDNLQTLVLDEADRIMDMGFQGTIDAIIEHLPKERQTMLFSATQTKRVSDLARLSLRDPVYLSSNPAENATPNTLTQNYIVTSLPEKLDTLWSFIRSNLKAKTVVFLSSGKQVRFVYEAFRHMRPGVPLLHLHGRQKLGARMDITRNFSSAMHSCLFATDVAARGLDFPAVDWVVQADCPEDVDTYIHRVGRTARYERVGRGVLFLLPSEEAGMVQRLEQKKIPIEKIGVKAKKQQSIKNQLQNMCFKDTTLKYLGQKAFVSYVKSVHVQKDKEIFNVKDLPLEEYAAALGLPGAPKIKFIHGEDTKGLKNRPRQLAAVSSDEESEEDDDAPKEKAKAAEPAVRTKYDRIFERRNQDVLSEHYSKLISEGDLTKKSDDHADSNGGDDDDGDFLSVKRKFDVGDEKLGALSENDDDDDNHAAADDKGGTDKPGVKKVEIAGHDPLIIDSKRREKLLKSKKNLLKYKGKGSKLVYDDDGNAHEIYELEDEEAFKKQGAAEEQRLRFVEMEKERTRLADIRDKEIAKQKKKELKEKRKERAKAERDAMAYESDEDGVQLAPPEESAHDAPPRRGEQRDAGAADEPADLEALASAFLQ